MDLALLSVIIIIVALILFAIPKIPMSISAIIVMLAMALTGVIDFKTTYAGFSNSVIFLLASMGIMGQALVTTGMAQKIGDVAFKLVGESEKRMLIVIVVVSVILGIFVSGAVAGALLMPMVDCMVLRTNGKITRKHMYLPIGLFDTIANNLTGLSCSSIITCSGLLVAAGYRAINFLEPTVIALPALIVTFLLYYFVFYKLSTKWFDFPDPPIGGDTSNLLVDTTTEEWKSAHPVWKQVVAIAAMVGSIVAIICGVDMGAAPLVGATVVILTGCLNEKEAYRSISWSTVVIAAASIGFSAGLSKSGGGDLIANWFMGVFSFAANSPFAMTIVMFVIAGLISQVMADSGAIACTAPIAIAICQANGWDPLPMVICTAMAVKTALATPICVATITQIAPGGYRFKDYLSIGGLVTLSQMVVILVMTYFVYYI